MIGRYFKGYGYDYKEPDPDVTAPLSWSGAGYTLYDWPLGQSPFSTIVPEPFVYPAEFPTPFHFAPFPSTTVYFPKEHEQFWPIRLKFPEWGVAFPWIPYWAFTSDMLHRWVGGNPEPFSIPLGINYKAKNLILFHKNKNFFVFTYNPQKRCWQKKKFSNEKALFDFIKNYFEK